MTQQNNMKKAMWFGGPPGNTFQQIKERLLQHRIDIVQQYWSKQRLEGLPHNIDFVIINIDMIGHPLNWRVKELCKKNNIPFVAGSLNKSVIIRNLIEAGLIKQTQNNHQVQTQEKKEEEEMTPIVNKPAKILPLYVQEQTIPERLEMDEEGMVLRKEIDTGKALIQCGSGRPSYPILMTNKDNENDVALFISRKDAAKYLQCHESSIYNGMKANKLFLNQYKLSIPPYEIAFQYIGHLIRFPEVVEKPQVDKSVQSKRETQAQTNSKPLFKLKKLYGGTLHLEPISPQSVVFFSEKDIPAEMWKFIEKNEDEEK